MNDIPDIIQAALDERTEDCVGAHAIIDVLEDERWYFRKESSGWKYLSHCTEEEPEAISDEERARRKAEYERLTSKLKIELKTNSNTVYVDTLVDKFEHSAKLGKYLNINHHRQWTGRLQYHLNITLDKCDYRHDVLLQASHSRAPINVNLDYGPDIGVEHIDNMYVVDIALSMDTYESTFTLITT